MVLIHWKITNYYRKLRGKFSDEVFMLKITAYSLFYNSLTSWSSCTDTCFGPLFWIVDHTVRFLGPVSLHSANLPC